MKKTPILFLLVILALCFSLVACGGSEAPNEPEDGGEAIKVDEKLLTVDITLPASFFEGQDMTTFDPDEYVRENGFNKAVANDDGSITVTMTKAKHNEFMTEMQKTVDSSLQDLIDDAEIAYVRNITYDKGYRVVTVEVDRAEYDAAFIDFVPFTIGLQVMFYQTFAGDELHCEVITKDGDTGETIASAVYPDVFEAQE